MKLLKLTTKNGIEFQSQERMNNFFWAGRLIILYLIIAAFDIQINSSVQKFTSMFISWVENPSPKHFFTLD